MTSVIFLYFEFVGGKEKKKKRDKRVATDLLKAVNIRLFIEPCQVFTTFEWSDHAYSTHTNSKTCNDLLRRGIVNTCERDLRFEGQRKGV